MRTVEILRRTPLFNNLDEEQLHLLAETARILNVERKQTLFLEGDDARSFFVVISGSIKVFKISPTGKEHVLHIAVPPQSFAEAAIFSKTGYPAHAEAVETSEIIAISKSTFLDILHRDKNACNALMADLCIWIRRLSDIITSLSFQDVERRLTAYLFKECQSSFGQLKMGEEFDLGVEKAVLASYLGTIPETLSRAIRKLQQGGLFEIKGSKVILLNATEAEEFLGQ